MRARVIVPVSLILAGALLGSCSCDKPKGSEEGTKVFRFAQAIATERGADDTSASTYGNCVLDAIDATSPDDSELQSRLVVSDNLSGDSSEEGLRAAMAKAGIAEATIDEILASCEAKAGLTEAATGASGPADTQAPTPSEVPTTDAVAIDFPGQLLAMVAASTDGMVPPDKQVCYRDALLAALPAGADTVADIPSPITKDSLQIVLGKLNISVQQQGDLLGKCMMS